MDTNEKSTVVMEEAYERGAEWRMGRNEEGERGRKYEAEKTNKREGMRAERDKARKRGKVRERSGVQRED